MTQADFFAVFTRRYDLVFFFAGETDTHPRNVFFSFFYSKITFFPQHRLRDGIDTVHQFQFFLGKLLKTNSVQISTKTDPFQNSVM